MWRIWTRGFGIRDWWYWFNNTAFPLWFARHLPKKLAYWTFIMVYANGVDSPDSKFKQICDAWENK